MTDTAPGPPAFPMKRGCPMSPPGEYTALREEGPISRIRLPSGKQAWLIVSHEHARKLLSDPRVSSDRAHPGFPAYAPGLPASAGQGTGFLLWMDPPDHTLYRRMITGEFTARRLRELRPRVEEITRECVVRMLASGRPADLVAGVSLPLPSLVICELLGVPYEDREVFQGHTRTMATNRPHAEKGAALLALREYLGEIIARKEREPGDDLLSRLVAKYHEAGVYDHGHLTGQAMFLLMAGHETTANMISLGAVALLENPDQLAAIREEPDLVRSAVDELLRFFSITDPTTSRVALEDIEIGGQLIRRGEGVIASNAAANHDEQVFGRPGDLDVRRDARRHLAFGYGVHQCLGQNLARLELECVFAVLFAQAPGLRLAVPAAQLPYKDDAHVYGIHEVPVTW